MQKEFNEKITTRNFSIDNYTFEINNFLTTALLLKNNRLSNKHVADLFGDSKNIEEKIEILNRAIELWDNYASKRNSEKWNKPTDRFRTAG